MCFSVSFLHERFFYEAIRYAQHSTAQHSTAQHSTAQHSTAFRLKPLAIALCGALSLGVAQAQETFTYNGTTPALQEIDGVSNSLAPANLNSFTGNRITINYDPAAGLTNIGGDAMGAFNDANNALSGNHITMTNGQVGGDILGAYNSDSGNVTSNTATVSGGEIRGVYGGYSDSGNAERNTATVSGGTMGGSVYGSYTYSGNAERNTATVSSGTVDGSVYGGYTYTGNATGNTATVSGGTVSGHVYGGYTYSGSATGNTVSISGAPVFNADPATGTWLFGGRRGSIAAGDIRTGNTLQMRTTGVTVNNIANFQNLHFYLPNTIAAGDTMLTLTSTSGADISSPAGQPSTKIGVALAVGAKPALVVGDSITLIQADGGLTADANLANNTNGMAAINPSLRYDFNLSANTNDLIATLSGIKLNPQTKSYSEGRLGGLAFVNQGADMASGTGMERATAAAQAGSNAFGAISGGSSRYESGSHVDVKGFSLIAGAATNLPNSAGKLMLGGFFEAGWGNYDSFNSFVDVADVNGKGDNRYYGAGVLAKQSFGDKFYAEGSVRAGKLENDFSGVLANTAVSYKMDKAYYGAHLGAGYVLPLGTGELDMYGKYLWTRQKGGNVVIAGDAFTFKDINSQRTRLGARYSYPLNTSTTLKLGAAWEYEFDAKAKASVHGMDVTAPEIKGSTAVLDAGIKLSPASNKNLSFEAGIQGYAGKRKGVTGNVAVKYAF